MLLVCSELYYSAYFTVSWMLVCFQVKPILLSVLLDRQEPEQVRTAAFIVVKESHPSFTTLQLIAHSLRTEPSRQIKTLIYSSLVNLAKTKSDITEIRATYVPSSLPLSATLFSVLKGTNKRPELVVYFRIQN